MGGTIIVQGPSTIGRTPERITLDVGESALVGVCNCGQCDFALRIADPTTSPFASRISARAGFWMFSNLSAETQVTVTDMDDWYQYIVVEPGRMHLPVPFEVAQIELTSLPDGPKLAVFGQKPRYATDGGRQRACSSTSRRPLLDHRSTYYLVLRELSRDRLNGVRDTGLPTSGQIAERLSRVSRGISPRAVDAHIAYVSQKLRLRKGANRDALVTFAIRYNLVTQTPDTPARVNDTVG